MAAESKHVVVIGAGAVGMASALQAQARGWRVTVVEPGPAGGRQAASFGNAGWLSSHSILPPALPGTWKKVPGWLRDPTGPLVVRWGYLPKSLPWLLQYLAAGWSWEKIEHTARALRSLLRNAPALHAEQARAAGVPELIEQQGALHVFATRAQFEMESRSWDLRREAGIAWEELDAQTLHEHEPDLEARYALGIRVPEAGRCRNPGAYVAALARQVQAQGGQWRASTATGFRIDAGRLRAVITQEGDIACDKAVIATGVRSKALAAQAGDAVPLAAERGYHVLVRDAQVGARTSSMFGDRKVVVNWTDMGLRVSGIVEIADIDAPPDWRHAERLKAHLFALYPQLASHAHADPADYWQGCRPSLPDGLACISPASKTGDIVHAFGHGHVGLVGSANTGRLVAQLLAGEAPDIDLTPFSARRFA